MKRTFNLRIPVLCAFAIAFGTVYAAVLVFFHAESLLVLIPPIILLAACVPVAILAKSISKPLILILFSILFLAGGVYTLLKCAEYVRVAVPCGVSAEISGKVQEVNFTSGGSPYLVLKNVTVDGQRLNGKLIAWLGDNAGEYCRKGYTVEFYSSVQKLRLIENGVINYRAVEGISYSTTVNGGMEARYGFSLFGIINEAIQNCLNANASAETAAVCYAMLTGNTAAISEGTLSAFRFGGVAHVFAVSGLHIGVIYGILSFVFNKLRFRGIVAAVIKIAFIAAYAGVCGFSPSSVRAVVGCSVSAVAACLYCKYDMWNALSVSAVIILLINPLYLFGASFLLSFSAMLGITLFSRNFKSVFSFLPEKLGGGLAVSFSAQLGTAPSSLATFGYVSAAGLFLNIIFVPVISVLYVILFACTVLGIIISPAAPVSTLIGVTPIEFVINLIATCGFEKSLISAETSWVIYLPFLALAVGMTDKLQIRPFLRCAFVASAVIFLLAGAVSAVPQNKAFVTFDGGYAGGCARLQTDGGTVLIFTDDYKRRNDNFADGACAAVLIGEDFSAVYALGGQFEKIYVRGGIIETDVGGAEVVSKDKFELCGAVFGFSSDGVTVTVEDISFRITTSVSGFGDMRGVRFNLCADGKNSVLFTDSGNYGLAECGEIRYELDDGRCLIQTVLP